MKYIQLLNIKIKHLIIMSKIMSNLIIFLVLFYFISSQEEKTNTTNNTENVEEDINFKYNSDPFKDLDFGNLIWLDDSNATTEINKYDLIYVFMLHGANLVLIFSLLMSKHLNMSKKKD